MIDVDIEHENIETQNKSWNRFLSPQTECFETSGANVSSQQQLPSYDIQGAYVSGMSNFVSNLILEQLVEKHAKTVSLFMRRAIKVEKRLIDRTLKARFRQLARKWKRETSHLSSISRRSMHMSYQTIIGMGSLVVPLILKELKKEPDDWFWALMAITQDNPVPESARGDIDRMTEAWLEWGRSRGLET